VFALASGLLLVALGAGSSLPGLVAYTFCAFVLGAIVLEFVRGTRARKALGDATWLGAFSSLVGRNRRRYGGYIVHAAIVLLALGIAGGAYGATKVQKLEPGQTMSIHGYDLRYLGSVTHNEPNRTEIRARLEVFRGGRDLGVYEAGKNNYPVEQQVSNEVGIRTDWLRAEDLFLIGDQFNGDGSVVIKALVNPLVDLIWLAGLVFLLGSLIAMWPDEREQRRLARHAEPVVAT
jgi:cytochrome c-type biogenesis protein CcmF